MNSVGGFFRFPCFSSSVLESPLWERACSGACPGTGLDCHSVVRGCVALEAQGQGCAPEPAVRGSRQVISSLWAIYVPGTPLPQAPRHVPLCYSPPVATLPCAM